MTPVEQAAKILGADFRGDLEWFLLNGYVISRPDLFAMGCLCPRGAFIEPWETEPWEPADCDSFFAWVCVGDLAELLKAVPENPHYLGWHRRNRGWNRNHWVRRVDFMTRTG